MYYRDVAEISPPLHLNPIGQSVTETLDQYRHVFFNKLFDLGSCDMLEWQMVSQPQLQLPQQLAAYTRRVESVPRGMHTTGERTNQTLDWYLTFLDVVVDRERLMGISSDLVRYPILHEMTEAWVGILAVIDVRYEQWQSLDARHNLALQNEFAFAAVHGHQDALIEQKVQMDRIATYLGEGNRGQYEQLCAWSTTDEAKQLREWDLIPNEVQEEELLWN